jgi:hypothetical protein
MKKQLLSQYPEVLPQNIVVTGTPQFDFHFKSEFVMPRESLCAGMGLDPARPFVLYTTGLDTDFLDEHKFIEGMIEYLNDPALKPKPQLVVRTYIKGTSPQVEAIAKRNLPDVVFPPILWDKQWTMPLHEDLSIYSSLLHHCALGVNAASTVTLELMALNKPVINIGMEPPGSKLPHYARFSRHVEYEHYRPVADSGGVMVARSMDDLKNMIHRGLTQPNADSAAQTAFMHSMLGSTLDGNSGRRVADALVDLAHRKPSL